MSNDLSYASEQEVRRFTVLKGIYRASKCSIDTMIDSNEICKTTGVCSEDLRNVLNYLKSRGLIKAWGSIDAMFGGVATVSITHEGITEVEAAIKKPHEDTKNFPAQVINNVFNDVVGGFQQGGQNNSQTITQYMEGDGIPLTSETLESLEKLIDRLTNGKHDDLPRSQAYQAAGILMELQDAALNQDRPGQIKAVSKWRQWISKLSERSVQILGFLANVGSALPLLKLLGLPVP